MRKGLLIVLLFAVTSGYAQFKDDNIFKPTVREGIITHSPNLIFGFINPDNLNLEVDASLVHSPYSSFGKNHQNMLNGIYLSKAQLNYQPWDNFNISVQYRSLPGNYYSPYSGFYGYNRNFFNNNLFIDD